MLVSSQGRGYRVLNLKGRVAILGWALGGLRSLLAPR